MQGYYQQATSPYKPGAALPLSSLDHLVTTTPITAYYAPSHIIYEPTPAHVPATVIKEPFSDVAHTNTTNQSKFYALYNVAVDAQQLFAEYWHAEGRLFMEYAAKEGRITRKIAGFGSSENSSEKRFAAAVSKQENAPAYLFFLPLDHKESFETIANMMGIPTKDMQYVVCNHEMLHTTGIEGSNRNEFRLDEIAEETYKEMAIFEGNAKYLQYALVSYLHRHSNVKPPPGRGFEVAKVVEYYFREATERGMGIKHAVEYVLQRAKEFYTTHYTQEAIKKAINESKTAHYRQTAEDEQAEQPEEGEGEATQDAVDAGD
ncbi:hypothetical protein HZB01_03175 [Candidatus Woesearchaeota archaeon]|nr:hypothetical protein [Candidatus Woesearchaeota archaeon]